MMDRELDPIFVQARTIIEEVLDAEHYRLASERHYPEAFGSSDAEYRGDHERIRLTWDGKDRWVGLAVARVTVPNQQPAPEDWGPLEPMHSSAPNQFLRQGPGADARIAALCDALREHLAAAIKRHR